MEAVRVLLFLCAPIEASACIILPSLPPWNFMEASVGVVKDYTGFSMGVSEEMCVLPSDLSTKFHTLLRFFSMYVLPRASVDFYVVPIPVCF